MKQFYIYILASRERGTLYIGLTSDLIKRVYQHKNGLADGFTKKHSIKGTGTFICYQGKRCRNEVNKGACPL
ncbi:GIY-YIG nuclease family protein [bacterium]|nr:GIY-YIG nuclease family protein [bacterium]